MLALRRWNQCWVIVSETTWIRHPLEIDREGRGLFWGGRDDCWRVPSSNPSAGACRPWFVGKLKMIEIFPQRRNPKPSQPARLGSFVVFADRNDQLFLGTRTSQHHACGSDSCGNVAGNDQCSLSISQRLLHRLQQQQRLNRSIDKFASNSTIDNQNGHRFVTLLASVLLTILLVGCGPDAGTSIGNVSPPNTQDDGTMELHEFKYDDEAGVGTSLSPADHTTTSADGNSESIDATESIRMLSAEFTAALQHNFPTITQSLQSNERLQYSAVDSPNEQSDQAIEFQTETDSQQAESPEPDPGSFILAETLARVIGLESHAKNSNTRRTVIAMRPLRNQSRAARKEVKQLESRLLTLLQQVDDEVGIKFVASETGATEYTLGGTVYVINRDGYDHFEMYLSLRPHGANWTMWQNDSPVRIRRTTPNRDIILYE